MSEATPATPASLMGRSRRWAMLVLLFLASVLNYLDRQTLSIVMHSSYVPVFFATGSMHVVAAVILAVTVGAALRRARSV